VVNNCRLDLENFEELAAMPSLPETFMAFERPKEVPVDWHRTENQGRLGSCQGTALTSVLERLWLVMTGEVVQLSKIFAYLGSQQIGNLLGIDQGSRPTDGIKLALNYGAPEETLTGYPAAYPGSAAIKQVLSKNNFAAALRYKAKSACVFRPDDGVDAHLNFIGGGGAEWFGIKWYDGLIPADRIVRKYAPPKGVKLGGHSNAMLGYDKNGLFIPVNSWKDGPYKVTPEALLQMARYPRNVFAGLMGNEGKPVDWVKDSPWNFKG
jgi:hypothetical protein